MSVLLSVENLTKKFGELTAVDACSFTVEEGSITALIGPNGSGKTTVFNLITGYLPSDSGKVEFAGSSIHKQSPGTLYRKGLTRTFQQARVFADLTVQENLVVAGGGSWKNLFGRRITVEDRARADEL